MQARARARYERGLEAAEQVFADLGVAAATTNHIAARAGTSIGWLYTSLGNKEAIAVVLAERYRRAAAAAFEEVVDGAGAATPAVASLVEVVEALHARHQGLGPLLRTQGSRDLETAKGAIKATLADAIELLLARRRGSSDPERRRQVAEMCAVILWRTISELADVRQDERPARLAELKLALTSYVAEATADSGQRAS